MTKQNMRYDWEDDACSKVDADCDDYTVIGVAVANTATGEACFIDMSDAFEGVERADYMQDVKGDVDCSYDDSVRGIRKWAKQQRVH